MNIERKNIDEVNATLTMQIEKADYQEGVEKTLRDYRKKANIPGFRAGMVPMSYIKKMYGKEVLGIERSTFVFAADGRLAREWRGVKLDGHAQEVLDYVRSL